MLSEGLAAWIGASMRGEASGEKPRYVQRVGELFGMPIYIDDGVPEDELLVMDMERGKVIGRVTGIAAIREAAEKRT